MKKTFIVLALLLHSFISDAQVSEGGLPPSLRQTAQANQNAPKINTLNSPDWAGYLEKEKSNTNFSTPYMVALFTEASISYPGSGSFTLLNNGDRIWKSDVAISGAPAIGLYFDQFKLPEGVAFYLMNSNKKQILGAYTEQNNNEELSFAIEPVQGEQVSMELFIPAGVPDKDILFSINRAAVYHRAIENLKAFVSDSLQLIDAIDDQLNGSSSTCMINSICPQGTGFDVQRKSTLQVLSPIGNQGVGACTGTMVNTTANNPQDCKRYVLFASHCDGGSGTANTQFAQSLFRFNFEYSACQGGPAPTSNTLTGATFVARSFCPEDIEQIDGDFLLLELQNEIPEAWDVMLSGWDRNPNIPTSATPPAKFIGFHHPDGDNKKLSTYQFIQSEALGAPGSHWATITQEGYVSTGSSGSGLFTNSGHLIGIASIAGENTTPPANCKLNAAGNEVYAMDLVAYSKLSRVWEYTTDGNEDSKKLKPWLDPNNSGAMQLGPTNSTCTQGNPVVEMTLNIDDAVSIYPNPVTDGTVNIQFNLEQESDLQVELMDVNGRSVNKYLIKNAKQGQYAIQTATLSAGMYLVKFNTGNATTTKKIMIVK